MKKLFLALLIGTSLFNVQHVQAAGRCILKGDEFALCEGSRNSSGKLKAPAVTLTGSLESVDLKENPTQKRAVDFLLVSAIQTMQKLNDTQREPDFERLFDQYLQLLDHKAYKTHEYRVRKTKEGDISEAGEKARRKFLEIKYLPNSFCTFKDRLEAYNVGHAEKLSFVILKGYVDLLEKLKTSSNARTIAGSIARKLSEEVFVSPQPEILMPLNVYFSDPATKREIIAYVGLCSLSAFVTYFTHRS